MSGREDRGQEATLELESIDCILCGSAEFVPCFKGRDERYESTPRDEFTLVECTGCTLRYLRPRPTERSLDLFYPTTYYEPRKDSQRSGRSGGVFRRLYPPRADRVLREKIARARALAPPGGRILEVGPAAGQCMEVMRDAGFSVVGLERNPEMVEHVRAALGLECYTPEEFRPEEMGEFDAVVLWNVFEHLSDPIGLLGLARGLLRPGGGITFSVPNAVALERTVFYRGESCEDIPRHLFSYSPRTIRALLEQEGFEVLRVDSATRCAMSELQERTERAFFRRAGGRPAKKLIYNFGVLPVIWVWDRLTAKAGRGHTLVVSARRR